MTRRAWIFITSLPLLTASACGSPAGSPDEGQTGETGADETVTWHQDIAPLVHEHCVSCHATGGAAPFSMESYESAEPWAETMLGQVEAGNMPPWGAIDTPECTHPHAFEHDPSLSDEEKQLLADWVDAGAPEGDPETAAPLPEPPSLDLENPDGVFAADGEFVVEGLDDQFWCTSIDPAIGENAWITALQLIPGNEKVVHHVLLYVDPTGASASLGNEDGYFECFGEAGIDDAQLVGGYIPGALPMEPPDGVGIPLPEGARIIMSFHYHPTGAGAEPDRSSLALKWSTTPPEYEAGFEIIGNFDSAAKGLQPGPNDDDGTEFMIPANTAGHTETMTWEAPADLGGEAFIWSAANHMHYIGVDQLTEIERTNGDRECLLQTPRWDFDWQRVYEIDAPVADLPRVRAGDKLHMRCTYDNTLNNPSVKRALAEQGLTEPVDVYLGDGSLDEMCLVAVGVAYER